MELGLINHKYPSGQRSAGLTYRITFLGEGPIDDDLMAVRALLGLNSPTGPSPVPPLNPAPVPTTGRLAGPLPGPASTSVMKPNMPDHQDLASHDTDISEERIPFYLKRKGVEKKS